MTLGIERPADLLKRESVQHTLSKWFDADAARLLRDKNAAELEEMMNAAMASPIVFDRPHWWAMMTAQTVAEEVYLFEKLRVPQMAAVLEIASGDQIGVPLAVECHTEGYGSYTTANLNALLTKGFHQAAKRLSVQLNVIEDDAIRLDQYLPPESLDAVIFQHAVNDVVQSIVADQVGIDTIHSDWYDVLPAMIAEVAGRYEAGTLTKTVKPVFMRLMQVVCSLLKKDGILFFTHWEYEDDIRFGYPMELYRNFLPITREWLAHSELPLEEVLVDGFDPQYRMILRKTR